MKIILTYTELRALLAPVIPHAGTDDMLPALTTIPVAAAGDYLVAQATDRFTAGFKRVKPAAGVPDGFAITLGASDAKRMINLFRPARGSDPSITIEIDDDDRIHASADDAGLALGFVGLNVSFLTLPATTGFPDLASLVPAGFDDATSTAGFNIALLARFRAAMEHSGLDRNEQALQLQMGANDRKPMFVTAGDDFIGLIMPRRVLHAPAVDDVFATWRGNIPRNGTKPPLSQARADQRLTCRRWREAAEHGRGRSTRVMVFKGRRLSVGHECVGEEFLVTVHEDGTATVATRMPADPSWYWSPPVQLVMEPAQ